MAVLFRLEQRCHPVETDVPDGPFSLYLSVGAIHQSSAFLKVILLALWTNVCYNKTKRRKEVLLMLMLHHQKQGRGATLLFRR